jgi:hypothetical protein
MRLLASGTTLAFRCCLREYHDLLGCFTSPSGGHSIATITSYGLPWAVDNGAFTGFDETRFRSLVARVAGQPNLLWVVAPDVVADARATLRLFLRWQPWLVGQGVPVAFAGQDGAEDLDLPWHAFRTWFIGGTTAWKLSRCSADLVHEARQRGKLVHMGRVNSRRRLWAAYTMGCDSVDGGALSRWGDRHLLKFCRWLRLMKRVQLLWR